MEIKISRPAEKAIEILENAGFEAYIVGGCVRDSLLGITPSDFDITTSATPKETEKAFEGLRLIETGLKHGTVTVLIDNEPIEITTFRTEEGYRDGRHPDKVEFTRTLSDDLIRRDFTFNAVAYSPKVGLFDITGGVDDLKNNTLRAVGDPKKRFSEDGLRILRALRFASVYGFIIEEDTARAIHECVEMLRALSGERIFSELKKLLCGKNVFRILTEYPDVICKIIPELAPAVGFDQKNPHHIYDIYTHTAKTVECIKPAPTLRLAALLHDVGKPSTFTEIDGIGHFYGHGEKSVEIAENVLRRLKSDSKTINDVKILIKHHDPVIKIDRTSILRKMRRLGCDTLSDLLELKSADNLAQSPDCHARLDDYQTIREIMEALIAEDACLSLKTLDINGNDLISLGFKEGKAVGQTLTTLLEAVESGKVQNERTALLEYAKLIFQHLR